MQIFVRTISGRTLTFNVNDDSTINQIKQEISKREQVPVSTQVLLYAGKPLDDSKTLSDYGIFTDSTLHLVYRLPGGSSKN